jgi:hypothetical protein
MLNFQLCDYFVADDRLRLLDSSKMKFGQIICDALDSSGKILLMYVQ